MHLSKYYNPIIHDEFIKTVSSHWYIHMSKTFSSHRYIHMSEVFNNTEKCSQKFFTSQKNFKLFWYYHEKPAVKIYKEKYSKRKTKQHLWQ